MAGADHAPELSRPSPSSGRLRTGGSGTPSAAGCPSATAAGCCTTRPPDLVAAPCRPQPRADGRADRAGDGLLPAAWGCAPRRPAVGSPSRSSTRWPTCPRPPRTGSSRPATRGDGDRGPGARRRSGGSSGRASASGPPPSSGPPATASEPAADAAVRSSADPSFGAVRASLRYSTALQRGSRRPPAATTRPAPGRAGRSPCTPPGPASRRRAAATRPAGPARCRWPRAGRAPSSAGPRRRRRPRRRRAAGAAGSGTGRRRRPRARRGTARRVLESCRPPRQQCRTPVEQAFDDIPRSVPGGVRRRRACGPTVCTQRVAGQVLDRHRQRQRPVRPVGGAGHVRPPLARRRRRPGWPTAAGDGACGQQPVRRSTASLDRRAVRHAAAGAPAATSGRARSSSSVPVPCSRCSSTSAPVHSPATVGRSWVVTAAIASAGQSRRVVVLEPEQPVGQDPVLGQRLADAVLDRAEVLADDERLRPVALQRDDVEQVLGRVADVGAVGRPTPPAGHPPQPEQPHDVVDAQAAGAGDRGADRLDERLVVGVPQPPRDQRRRAPVLALRVERVRRRADARRPRRARPARPRRRRRRRRRRSAGPGSRSCSPVAAASCRSSTHCSQAWKATTAPCCST